MERKNIRNKENKIELCRFGNNHKKNKWHSCPYAYDVNNDKDEEFCQCCDECEELCKGDI